MHIEEHHAGKYRETESDAFENIPLLDEFSSVSMFIKSDERDSDQYTFSSPSLTSQYHATKRHGIYDGKKS